MFPISRRNTFALVLLGLLIFLYHAFHNTFPLGNFNLKGDVYFATLRLRFWWSRHLLEMKFFTINLSGLIYKTNSTTEKMFRILAKSLKTTCKEINFFKDVASFRPTACEFSQVFARRMRNLYRIIPGALKMKVS